MQKITPFLWFDKEAEEAARLYASLFKGSRIKSTSALEDTPSGTVGLVSVELMGHDFRFMSAGPLFKFNPSVSFLVCSKTREEVDAQWRGLSAGGTPLMELDAYPFSERYGWIQDRFGLSWQLMFVGERGITQNITPTLMFVGKQCGKAEEAINFYGSVFGGAKTGHVMRYGKGEEPDREGTIKHAVFSVAGREFAAMDSAHPHNFTFNEAISFMVHCDNQKEIDYYWEKLSADPKAEQCGWIKDRFGLSWQIVPVILDEMFGRGDKTQVARVTGAFLKMKKFDIETLKRAYEGK